VIVAPRTDGAASPHRLEAIEGFRAYLAFWVVICHAMWASGYLGAALPAIPELLLEGRYAVDVFIVISAFVIFLLLDKTHMPVTQFLTRRFFRLYPLFISLFLLAIPLSLIDHWNVTHAGAYLSQGQISYLARIIESGWQNLHWHSALHAVMLNGAVPQRVLPNAPGAFLDPAWSVSLEWQFYLVAPIAFALAVSARPSRRVVLALGCLALIALTRWQPLHVEYGAALPFHVAYFAVGGASYFFYRWYKRRERDAGPFALGLCAGMILIGLGGRENPFLFIPAALWAVFFGLLLESHASPAWRVVSPLFTNPVAQYLGRVSYSVYLSHILVMTLLRYALLRYAPELSRGAHFAILLVATAAGTIAVSALLYRFVEVPGIQLGRALAKSAKPRVRERARALPGLPASARGA
jgi:peptidoglycan/LPS O-acetylase OafA/YrhL